MYLEAMLPVPQMSVQQDADRTGSSTHTSSHCKALEDLADHIFRAKDPASRVQYASVIKLCPSSHGTKPAPETGIAMVTSQESNFRSSSSATIHRMSTRSLRPRASVDYSARQESGTGTPGWLKSKGRAPQSHSRRRQTESAVPQQGKENAGTAKGARSSEPHTGNNGKASMPAKDAAGVQQHVPR